LEGGDVGRELLPLVLHRGEEARLAERREAGGPRRPGERLGIEARDERLHQLRKRRPVARLDLGAALLVDRAVLPDLAERRRELRPPLLGDGDELAGGVLPPRAAHESCPRSRSARRKPSAAKRSAPSSGASRSSTRSTKSSPRRMRASSEAMTASVISARSPASVVMYS